jgi:glutamate racemase
VSATRNGRVGVIGTVGTIGSGAYQQAVDVAAAGLGVTVDPVFAACPGFVEFVERGEADSDQVHVLAERLLAPVRGHGVDTLLLGCTHYPYLARTLSDVLGRDVVLVSSADETALAVSQVLDELGLVRDRDDRVGVHRFVSSGNVGSFARLGQRLLGPELVDAEGVAWD